MPNFPLNVLNVPDHDEAPVVSADHFELVHSQTSDWLSVTNQDTETLVPLAPERHLAVKAGGPEAHVVDGEAGDAAASLVTLQAGKDPASLGTPELKQSSITARHQSVSPHCQTVHHLTTGQGQ